MATRFYPTVREAAKTPLNRTQKILERFVQGSPTGLEGGAFVRIRPHAVLTHDNTAAVMTKFESLLDDPLNLRVKDPKQIVFALDHNVQDASPKVRAIGIHTCVKTSL
jgi:homoaconitate hydratase